LGTITDRVTIATADGACPATTHRPDGDGRWPAVVLMMDGLGIRPSMLEMGARLASYGYFVLLPDLFYRLGPYEPVDAKALMGDVEKRTAWFGKYFPSITRKGFVSDMSAFLTFLDGQPRASAAKIGTTGYCMGGGLSLVAAGMFPDRVAVAASFHGGRLATDDPESPHLLAPKMKAYVYVGGAVQDPSFPDEQKARLEKALTDAGVRHTVETYEGALHGWVPTDKPVYNREAAERHWTVLREILQPLQARA
jgi:carboxymethylenebutenolidase